MRPITAPLRPGDTGDEVAALQTALIVLLRRKAIVADQGLQQELLAAIPQEQEKGYYGDATAKAVGLYQQQLRRFDVTGEVDQLTADALNSLLRRLGLLDDEDEETEDDPSRYRVRGRLSSATRPGVGGIRILVVDRNIGEDTPLTQTRTEPDGSYDIEFHYDTAKAHPDLQARAYAGREALIGSSPVRYNAGRVEVLDIAVDDDQQTALAAEHQTLLTDLAEHYDGGLADLREDQDRADVTYLANKTGWDARAVAVAALADQFSARTSGAIAPGLFYALFRSGLPADETAVYALDAGAVRQVWQQAIDQGVIAADLADAVPDAVTEFTTLSARQALTGPALAGRSSVGELLKVTLPNAPNRHEEIVRLHLEHRGDPAGFWQAVGQRLGPTVATRLQLDGKLAYLTLNNAPLVQALHTNVPGDLTDPVQLVRNGFHTKDKWLPLIDTAPPEIPGDGEAQRRANYAQVLAIQLRLSYPTATLSAMVSAGTTPVLEAAGVREFLDAHAGTFDVSKHPIDQFVHRNNIAVSPLVRGDLARIQRIRQITPTDDAMNALLVKGIGSAYTVARYDREEFVTAFADAVGGRDPAALIHARAQQVHLAVLNIATSYVLASKAPGVGVHSPAQIVNPAPVVPANVGDVIAYPTLEKLLGDMDYCDCTDCRSVLSPAAYLVDLLQFLDRDDVRWAQFRSAWQGKHGGAPYPYPDLASWTAAGSPPDTAITPLAVLLARRPDLQYLPLTCENTNTALPYIDLVTETLEYYVTHGLTLDGFAGHSTDDQVSSEELLANPQFVQDAAYEVLAGAGTPAPLLPPTRLLPFHQPLQRLRRLFAAFGTPLPQVMALLRAEGASYDWSDTWMEQLRLSRPEYARLTDRTLSLPSLYGLPTVTSDPAAVTILAGAKDFCRRLELGYDDLIAILRTKSINPDGALIPKLERLGVPVATLQALHDGTISDADFDAALAPQLDPAQYGGDIKAWVRDPATYLKIMGLLTLTDPSGAGDASSFDNLEFRYADPARSAEAPKPSVFVRLLRFIRLWRALGWNIQQTDAALTALYPADQSPAATDDETTALAKLDAGWLTALPRLGVVARLAERLNLNVRKDLPYLIACFAPVDSYGGGSLYASLFAGHAPADQDPVFADDGYGGVLDGSATLFDHVEGVRAALSLTGDEFAVVTAALGYDPTTPLTLNTVSAVLRRGWLARRLKLSAAELVRLLDRTGLDVFTIQPGQPDLLTLLDFLDALRATELKPAAALYLIWNVGLGGASAPAAQQVAEFTRALRAQLAAVDGEFTVVDDPDGQITRARMALVYDNATTDLFFGLLGGTVVTDVPYGHPQPVLEPAILAAAPGRIGYDDFRKRLSFAGVMAEADRDALKAAGAAAAFQSAVDALYAANQQVVGPFFARYAELRPLHDAYLASADAPEQKRTALLAAFLPDLIRRRKRQLAVQAIGGAAKADPVLATTLLDNAAVLHAADDASKPALDDLVAVGQPGLSARFYLRSTATGSVDAESDAEAVVGVLPANGGNPVSAVWRGFLEAPATDFYNVRVDADPAADVALSIGGAAVALSANADRWTNTGPVGLTAGALAEIVLTVQNATAPITLSWQTTGRGWEAVPGRYLYPAVPSDRLAATYTRFFKTATVAAALRLTPAEIAFLATGEQIDGAGWLNALTVTGLPDQPTSTALAGVLTGLLGYAATKAAYSPDDDRLLAAVRTADVTGLCLVTGWSADTVTTLLTRFGAAPADLADGAVLARVAAAANQVAVFGVPATALLAATGNEPSAGTVRDFTAALRSRYAPSDWLAAIKPINDELRAVQRDALVSYVLHQMRSTPASAHIDTAEKLFEYFLMDVQMEPCMQTSRIRNALSAVQLFIDRCLMNLEPRVAASALNGRQWEWMRRYRVWEANRKVFLWPENWLEPELRDDQSPFFKEMMSELLQSDITEDTAATALGKYLVKLDTVAKLEPCGIHLVQGDPGTADDVAHVVARTTGAGPKYYSRRREYGYWTPWEEIKLDIEDTPVLPVVWRSRLFLFWVRVTMVPNFANLKMFMVNQDKNLTEVKSSEINSKPAKLTYQAILCFSEHAGGEWQPVQTSAATKPTTLDSFAAGAFDRTKLRLAAHEEGPRLRISLSGQGNSSFLLYNTHSLPVRKEDQPPPSPYAVEIPPATRTLSTSDGTLTASYANGGMIAGLGVEPLKRPIVRNSIDATTVAPAHDLADRWAAPFFYSDSRHVFYVSSAQERVNVLQWQGYGTEPKQPRVDVTKLPPIVYQKPVFQLPDRIGPVAVAVDNGLVDTASMQRYVTEDAYITKGIAALGTVAFGDLEIGPAGTLPATRQRG